MKALQKWFGRRGALPLTAYLAALAVWVVLGAFHLGSDSLARAQGRLTEETMAATDWQLVGLTPNEDGTLTTVDGDPQMSLENVGDRVVRTISYTAQFDGEARELCLYYTTKVGEDYSADRRVFPRSVGEGRYIYTLPRTSLAALRLDPCSPEENKAVTLTMSSITLNAALLAVFCAKLVSGILSGALPRSGGSRCQHGGRHRTGQKKKLTRKPAVDLLLCCVMPGSLPAVGAARFFALHFSTIFDYFAQICCF